MLEKLVTYSKRAEVLDYNSDEFIQWCEYNSNNLPNSACEYASCVILFLEYYKKFIGNLSKEDLLDYRKYLSTKGNSTNNRNKNQSAIKNFIKYLNKEFNYNIDLNVIPQIEKDGVYTPDASFLSIDEFTDLRNTLLDDENYRWLFYLEMVYRHGLKLEQLCQCTHENYREPNCFIIEEREVMIDQDLVDYIKLDQTILKELTRSAYQKIFPKIGQVINKDISWQTIANTREKHLILCPCCNNLSLNNGDNWIVAIKGSDVFNNKWLICTTCANKKGAENE